jgi:hypothetical protein
VLEVAEQHAEDAMIDFVANSLSAAQKEFHPVLRRIKEIHVWTIRT